MRLREYLEESNASYQELIIASKEVLRRMRLIRQQNEELIGQSKEFQTEIQTMDIEYSPLQRRSQTLDGLTMLAEAARKL